MNQDYYTELRQLTDMICRKYSADPNVEAAMVTGSVSLGQVDAVSDVDMMLYYRELPSAEIFESIKEEALASGGGIYGYDPDEGLACYFFVNGVKVDIAFQKTTAFAQMIQDFVADPTTADKNKLIIMSGIQQCVSLMGKEIIEDWQHQLNDLPASFSDEIVRAHLRFPPIAVLQEMGVDREDYGFVYELILEAVGNILTVLSGLNGMIPPGKIKGLALRLDKMAHKPANLAERVQQLWLLPPQEMGPHFYAIVDDLLTLVEARTPHISTQPVRERLQLRLEQR